MKTKTLTFALLASIAAFAGTTARADSNDNRFNNEPSRADHRDRGGDRNDRDERDYGRPGYGAPRTVVVVPAGPRHIPAPGFWRETVVKTWVPGYWVASRDFRGRPARTFVAGHYDSHIERTWVATGDYRR